MTVRRSLLPLCWMLLSGCAWFHTNTELPGLGEVPLKSVCSDAKSCDARGDAFENVLKRESPSTLAEGQGPEAYLGRVAPGRETQSALATCSSPVTTKDVVTGAPVLRSVAVTSDHRQKLRASLKAQLARLLAEQGSPLRRGTLEETVDAVAGAIDVRTISLSSQTFWLSDAAFERRVGECGEEKHGDIIYSMTVLELSELFRKDAESKLVRALELTFAAQPTESLNLAVAEDGQLAEASVPQALDELGAALLVPSDKVVQGEWSKQIVERRAAFARLAQETVTGLATDTRVIAAFGFDDP